MGPLHLNQHYRGVVVAHVHFRVLCNVKRQSEQKFSYFQPAASVESYQRVVVLQCLSKANEILRFDLLILNQHREKQPM